MASSGISRTEVEKAPGLLRGGEHRDRTGPVEFPLSLMMEREALFVAAEDPEKGASGNRRSRGIRGPQFPGKRKQKSLLGASCRQASRAV